MAKVWVLCLSSQTFLDIQASNPLMNAILNMAAGNTNSDGIMNLQELIEGVAF